MSETMESRNLVLSRRSSWPVALALFVATLGLAGCSNYEPKQTIEGVYRPPPECAQLQGHRDDRFSFTTVYPTVCNPIRVSELGIFTYGGNFSSWGKEAEMGRLEFSDEGVYVKTEALRLTGSFEYQTRQATLGDWTRQNPFATLLIATVALLITGAVVCGAVEVRAQRERERERLAAEEKRERERLAAEVAAAATERVNALARLAQLAAEAQAAARSLPIILGDAEITLDRAHDELRSLLPSPFWEAMEEVVVSLNAFQQALSVIEASRSAYLMQAAQLGSGVPEFTLGVSVLPDPAATHSRLNRLYREAQALDRFPMVYEQRRTNAILITGFRSLGQAIERLGGRIVDEISSLAASLDCRLVNLESSLESSVTAAAEQSAALRAELQRSHGVNDAILGQLRQDAEASSESERLALRMLDNIQRRRKPSIWDGP
jgi:hypothetical protein